MERSGLTPGSQIGGYTIVAPLGSGGMGTVYRAVDGGGEPVALKLLHPHVAADAVVRTRLMREVAALQRLRHPAVAAVLDAEADSTEAFLVTELVAGDTLTDHVREHGPLDADELLSLAEGLRSALAAVHAAGVVHRDLKPSNVLLTDDGPVLIDFGLAQGVDDDANLTTAGFVLGTPGYLAPELLDGGEPGPGTDLWGWAALLAFAATGRDPFGTRPVEAVLARARAGEVDLDGVGPLTHAAIAGALRPLPADRSEPDDVVTALRAVAARGELPPGAVPTLALAAGAVSGAAVAGAAVAAGAAAVGADGADGDGVTEGADDGAGSQGVDDGSPAADDGDDPDGDAADDAGREDPGEPDPDDGTPDAGGEGTGDEVPDGGTEDEDGADVLVAAPAEGVVTGDAAQDDVDDALDAGAVDDDPDDDVLEDDELDALGEGDEVLDGEDLDGGEDDLDGGEDDLDGDEDDLDGDEDDLDEDEGEALDGDDEVLDDEELDDGTVDKDDDLDDAPSSDEDDVATELVAVRAPSPQDALPTVAVGAAAGAAAAAAGAGTTAGPAAAGPVVAPAEPPVRDGHTVAVPVRTVEEEVPVAPAPRAATAPVVEQDARDHDGLAGDDHDDAADDGTGRPDGDVEEWDDEGPWYERPPARRRWGSLLALALVVVLAGMLWPVLTVAVVLVLVVAVRTVGATVEAMHDRRERRGVRRSDGPLAVLSVPWYLLLSVLAVLPQVLVGGAVVGIVAGLGLWLLDTGRWAIAGSPPGAPPQGPTATGLVGGLVVVAVLFLWWGPLSRMTRTGARRTLAAVAPGPVGALVVVVLALVGAVLLADRLLDLQPMSWWPVVPAPTLPAP